MNKFWNGKHHGRVAPPVFFYDRYNRLEELRETAFKLSEEEYRNWPLSGELSELENELEAA